MINIIVVLCDSFYAAMAAYDIFIEYLKIVEPFSIRKEYKECYCVETDDDLRYIFVDYRMKNVFKNMTPDYLDVAEFFEGVPGFHDDCESISFYGSW